MAPCITRSRINSILKAVAVLSASTILISAASQSSFVQNVLPQTAELARRILPWQKPVAETATQSKIKTPEFLHNLMPAEVDGFAIADVDRSGARKLVAWSVFTEDGPITWLHLVSVEGGRSASNIWKIKTDGLYDPKIDTNPSWTYNGRPLYVIWRNAGAAYQTAEPIWLDADGSLHELPSLEGDFIELSNAGCLSNNPCAGNKPVLICHSRPEPQSLDIPEIYTWDGKQFAQVSSSYPHYYDKLCNEALKEQELPACNKYGLAQLLVHAGRKHEAIALLKRIGDEVATCEDPQLKEAYDKLLADSQRN